MEKKSYSSIECSKIDFSVIVLFYPRLCGKEEKQKIKAYPSLDDLST